MTHDERILNVIYVIEHYIEMNKKLIEDNQDAIIKNGLEHENAALEIVLKLLEE